MAGQMGLKVGLEIIGLEKAKLQLAMAKAEAKKTKPLFDKAIIILEQSHMKTFKMQGRPGWKPSKRAGKQSGMTLQDTGRLRNSVTAKSSGAIREYNEKELHFGTNLIYAPSHQFGFPARNIPKRPFLGVYAEDIKKMEQVFGDDITQRLRVVTSVG